MRPLLYPELPTQVRKNWSLGAALLQGLGPFCAISERPLPDVMLAWHGGRGQAFADTVAIPVDWTEYLPIAPELTPLSDLSELSALALPNRDLTFSLGERLFDYALEEVDLFLTDDAGNTEAQKRDLVVVSGRTDAARRTVEAFRLNGAGYDGASHQLTMSKRTYLTMEDHLIFRRTEAWNRAEEVAKHLVEHDAPDLLVAQARLVAAATGYWSCWATVMQKLELPLSAIAVILGEVPPATSGLTGVAEKAGSFEAGHGPHHTFPGTDPRWLTLPRSQI